MPIPKTVATRPLKPTNVMRPSARPANGMMMPNRKLPGAHLSPKTVAKLSVKPTTGMRPRAPGHQPHDAHFRLAGRVPHTESGCNAADEQIGSAAMQPPRAPGQGDSDAHLCSAGRAPFNRGRLNQ
jgi:hypothetical protein